MASSSEKAARKPYERSGRKERKLEEQMRELGLKEESEESSAQQQGSQLPKVTNEVQILEAIDQLRRRKARPDADRICNYLLRKFCVDARDTIADLHLLIEAEKVIQVDYKGNVSYRNASNWSRLQLYKNRPEGFVKEKLNSSHVSQAVGVLVLLDPDYLDHGIPPSKLIRQLMDGASSPTSRRMIQEFLSKEVASGNLTKLPNGNYSLVGGTNMSSNGATAPANGDIKTEGKETSQPCKIELKDSMDDPDSSCNTLKSSHTSKTDIESMKKEDCYEIIIGRRHDDGDSKSKDTNGKVDNGYRKENKQNGRASHSPVAIKEEAVNGVDSKPTQRKSKTERKQRLCVRNDDSVDLEFEDYRKDTNYKDLDDMKVEDRYSDDDAGRSSTNPSPTLSHNNTVNFRSARRKRARKVFDPSDNMVVKKKRGRYAKGLNNQQEAQETKTVTLKESPKDPNRQCSLCSKNKTESLIACRDCTVRAHPSCIYTPEEMTLKANTNWQCERCKTCALCYETSDVGPLITCYKCDDAYHYSCHTPRIPSTKTKWFCSRCNHKPFKTSPQNSNSSNNNTNGNSSDHKSNNINTSNIARIITQASPTRRTSEHPEDEEEKAIDPSIPDASEWSVEQVFQYFYRYFPLESKIFKTEEIDGPTLMLLKRSDIINNFGLLGPSLKIWRHVVILQTRRDNTDDYWL